MPQVLERLLTELQRQPLDRSLDGVADEVDRRLAETAAMNTETWRLRTVAVLLVAMGGAAVSASSAAMAAPKSASPFVAWSNLAPSTLLESAE
jgi:hypothetical protein